MLCTVCANYINGLLFAPVLLLLIAAAAVLLAFLRGYTFDSLRGVPFHTNQHQHRTRYTSRRRYR